MKTSTLIILLFILKIASIKAQDSSMVSILQPVDVKKYAGKRYRFEVKAYLENFMDGKYFVGNFAPTVFTATKEKILSQNINPNAIGEYGKQGDWSTFILEGKIEKDAEKLVVGFFVMPPMKAYVDDIKLFIKDGKDIDIPLKNAGFEDADLKAYNLYQTNKEITVKLVQDRFFTGKQSLLVDATNVKIKKDTSLQAKLGNNPKVGKYVAVNGVKLYYETYGEGEPLLLLHGNNASMGYFKDQLADFSKKYKVIGLDSRGQGKSTSDSTKLTYELMAEDVNTFLDSLHLKNVNILGWSDGGNIGVILALHHPEKIKKMAIMGTVLYNDETSVVEGVNPLLKKQIKEMEDQGVPKTSMDYRCKMLLLTEPHVNPDDLKKIKTPVLVMAGETDVVKEGHTRLIAKKIPNSKLIIFKGAGHEAPWEIPSVFNKAVLDFLN